MEELQLVQYLAEHGQNNLKDLLKLYREKQSLMPGDVYDFCRHEIFNKLSKSADPAVVQVCQYLLASFYNGLEDNPFITFFLRKYWVGGLTSKVSNLILGEPNKAVEILGNKKVESLPLEIPDAKTIKFDFYYDLLRSKYLFPETDVEALSMPPLAWLHKACQMMAPNDIDLLVKQEVQSQRMEDLDDFCDPFNQVSGEIFTAWFKQPDEFFKPYNSLSKIKATNLSVDYVHRVIVSGFFGVVLDTDLEQLRRVLIYSFVERNLDRDDSYTTIRILCAFLRSLFDKGYLTPVENYDVLLSSFLRYSGSVPEAAELYWIFRSSLSDARVSR